MKTLKNIKFFIFIIIFLSIVVFSVISAMQYERNVDYIKMRQNLRIMENILNTILTEYDKEILPIRSTRTSGIFVDGYGVVFITSPSLDSYPMAIISKSLNIYSNYTKQYRIEELEKESIKKKEEILEELNNAIIGFLTDYAGAIKGLEPDDRITVVCKIPSGYKEALEKNFGIGDSNIIITVEREWLNSYKKGLINLEVLKNRIKNSSKKQYTEKEMYKRIDILESIIQSEVENRYNRISRNQIEGIYINGLGTIFSLNFDRTNFLGNVNFVIQKKYDAVNSYIDIKYNGLQEQIKKEMALVKKEMEQIEKSREEIEKAKEKLKEAKEKIKSEVKILRTVPDESLPTPEVSGLISIESPKTFSLSQNYPNPFNTNTTIEYQISEESEVEIRIYDVLGREVKTLIDEKKTTGYYEVVWDGRNNMEMKVSNGIYFCKFRADSFTDIKKIIFIKKDKEEKSVEVK